MGTFKRLWNDEQSLMRVVRGERPILEDGKELERNSKKLQDRDQSYKRKAGSPEETQDIMRKFKDKLRVRSDNDISSKAGELADVVDAVMQELDIENPSDIPGKLRELRKKEPCLYDIRETLEIRDRDNHCHLVEKHKKSHDDLTKLLQDTGKITTVGDASTCLT